MVNLSTLQFIEIFKLLLRATVVIVTRYNRRVIAGMLFEVVCTAFEFTRPPIVLRRLTPQITI